MKALSLARNLLLLSLLSSAISVMNANTDSQNRYVREHTDVDVAKTTEGGRVVYVSSGPRPGRVSAIDDDLRTRFPFADSDDHPVIVLQLPQTQPVHGVSIVPGSDGGQVDVYVMDRLVRDVSDLDYAQPIGSISDLAVGREAGIGFARTNARFVALRWKSKAIATGSLQVAEIRVFVKGDLARSAANAAPVSAAPPKFVVGPPVVVSVSPE